MSMPLHQTILSDVGNKSGEYPIGLHDAVEFLIEEQKNLVPLYMYGGTSSFGARINFLEAKVIDAEMEGEAEGNIEARKARQEIDIFRGKIANMVSGMTEWDDVYVFGVLWSDDLASTDPAITKPEDPQFSFSFKPKLFNLGLTGRLLEDESGKRFQENLGLDCDVYDAYNLAVTLSPQRIVAVDSHGKLTVVYEDGKELGRIHKVEKPNERVDYVFSEESANWLGRGTQVLPTNGKKVVFSEFYEEVKRYERATLIFGHQYSNINEFLSMVTLFDNHLMWRYSLDRSDPNTPLVDCEIQFGLKNDVKEFPEHKNRLLYSPNKADLYFNRVTLHFDKAVGIQALMSLGDAVTDIWFEPVDRDWSRGWDIVYDKKRHITPDRPVAVFSPAEMERYPVLKDFRYKAREQKIR